MRTNIDIDDELMAEAMRLTGLPTKKAVVEEALRRVIRLQKQKGILTLRGLWKDDPEAAARAADEGDDEDHGENEGPYR
jgi:Arc/MetJ family transcription regulator